AGRLNLPICIHASSGSFAWRETFARDSGFSRFKLPVVAAFHSLAYHGVPEKFPKLRFGFIEAGAQWVPYVLHDLAKRFTADGKSLGKNFMRENRLYVACQTDDDLAYILPYAGEDNIVIGSDYGHGDTAAEIDALRRLKVKSEVRPDAIEKILSRNPGSLYNL
ncbi:MAG: amidohydrolase family protein, partial [Candidatus Binatia bacterium]